MEVVAPGTVPSDARPSAEPALPAPAAAAVVACPNCGAALVTPYCGYCGQRAGAHLLSMREILAEVVDDQLSVNGTLLRTVVPLVTRPGFLTREYLDGRIMRYIPPFRTFLACMAVWLLAVTWKVQVNQPKIERTVDRAMARARVEQAERARKGLPVQPVEIMSLPVDTMKLPAFARVPLRPVARRYAEINAMDPGKAVTLVVGALVRSSSRVLLLLMPITAWLLGLVYIRKRRLFAEHFVFTLHLHAFCFAVIALQIVLPSWWPITVAGNVWLGVYALLALKRVYGDGWVGTVLHGVAFGALYLALVTVLNPVIVAIMLLTA